MLTKCLFLVLCVLEKKGKVVPRVVNRFSNRRKVSIEVHKIVPLTQETDSAGKSHSPTPYEECVIR